MTRLISWGVPALVVLLALAIVAGVCAAGRAAGVTATELEALQAAIAAEKQHQSALEELNADLDQLELEAAKAAARSEALQKSHRSEIDRYEQTLRAAGAGAVPCLDADGLRLWRQAIANAHPATEGSGHQPAGLPAAAAAGQQPAGAAAAQPVGGRRAVSGLSGQAPRVGADALPSRRRDAGGVR